MGKADQNSPLARRLRELEEEEKTLRQHIKSLSRQTRRPDGSRAEPTGPRLAPPERRTGASIQPRPSAGSPGSVPVEDLQGAELTRPEMDYLVGEESTDVEPVAPASRPLSPGYTATVVPPRPVRPNTERFATYFASGSFGKTRPLGHEKRLQRNKAIFMVLIVLLVAFVLYRMFF